MCTMRTITPVWIDLALQNTNQQLVTTLRRRARAIATSKSSIDHRSPAIRVIDCVLSLNRDYDAFVTPRLKAFAEKHPNVRSVRQLQSEISKYRSPADFVRKTLNYDHAGRANTLSAVVDWLSQIAVKHLAPKQLSNVKGWARRANSNDYKTLAINGFGLAGFQYLRILFGADTIKSDRYICKFVETYVGNRVSPELALIVVEAAALEAGVSRRKADHYIWQRSRLSLLAI